MALGQDTSLLTRSDFLAGYSYRMKLEIDETVVEGLANLTDFPFFIDITDNALRSVANGGNVYRNDGHDITFALDDGTELEYQREEYDPTTGNMQAWLKVPTLYASQTTEIWIYYGNCGGSVPDPSTDIWDTDYKGIYHLDNAGGAGVQDYSGNGYTLTNNGTNTTQGIVGRGLRFNSVDHLDWANDIAIVQSLSQVSMSAWINPTGVDGEQVIMSFSIGGSPGTSNSRLTLRLDDDALVVGGASTDSPLDFYVKSQLAGTIVEDEWTHVVGQVNYATDEIKIFINGAEVATVGGVSWANTQTPATPSSNSSMGAEAHGSGNHFGGKLDEVRIYSALHSADWLKTEYNNQSSTGYVTLAETESEITWLGNTSAWSSTTNWGGCVVPGASTTIVIPPTANDPLLSADITVSDVIIELGAGLSLGTSTLTMTGNLFNDGTINASSGAMQFGGGLTQDFVGNSFDVDNLIINKSGGASLRLYDAIDLPASSTLTLTAGHLELAGTNLDLRGTLSGGSANSYVIAGSDYCLNRPVGSSNVLFPLGSSSGRYFPATLNNSGVTDDFCIKTLDDVLADGETGAPQTGNAVDKTWFIDEGTPGGSDVAVVLQWSTPDELAGFGHGDAFVAHHNGAWWEELASSSVNDLGGGNYSITSSNVSDFSPFGVGSLNSILPVEWTSFQARAVNDEVVLTWQTATEVDNDHFAVERSYDGETFEEIGQVQGNGDSEEVRDYKFVDRAPGQGMVYYRLMQVDFDGKFSYSKIVATNADAAQRTTLAIFPTVNDGINFKWVLQGSMPQRMIDLSLYDLQGHEIMHKTLESTARGTLEGQGLTDWKLDEGIYILRLNDGDQVAAERMVVH